MRADFWPHYTLRGLLARAPALRRLCLNEWDNIRFMAACPNLETLELTLSEVLHHEVAAFMRSPHARHLSLMVWHRRRSFLRAKLAWVRLSSGRPQGSTLDNEKFLTARGKAQPSLLRHLDFSYNGGSDQDAVRGWSEPRARGIPRPNCAVRR